MSFGQRDILFTHAHIITKAEKRNFKHFAQGASVCPQILRLILMIIIQFEKVF